MTPTCTKISFAALATALAFASPAHAQGKADRAHAAIAAAQAKIDAANKIGATGEVPRLQAEAAAMLRKAREEVESGKKDEAIADANRASQLADTALGETQHAKAVDQRAAMTDANRTAASAQADAAAANERAAAAERAATASAMEAERARNTPAPAPVVFVTPPAPVAAPTTTTTVSTETAERPAVVVATKHVVRKRVVHHVAHRKPAPRAIVAKTTTTVKTEAN